MRRILTIASLLLLTGCSDHRSYDNAADFDQTQQAEGWVSLGKFGNNWPARTEETVTNYGGIEFNRADGTPHQYSGFEGYDLKVIKLRGPEGQELVRVLRSREMTGIVGDEFKDD